jgi:hypothetical protein
MFIISLSVTPWQAIPAWSNTRFKRLSGNITLDNYERLCRIKYCNIGSWTSKLVFVSDKLLELSLMFVRKVESYTADKFLANIDRFRKGSPGTNSLAFFAQSISDERKKRFIALISDVFSLGGMVSLS